jgi:hypothetical protein
LERAAKYYRLAAECGSAEGQNSFGICLERGIGVQSNVALAAHYYERSAVQGNPDGANNLGFCLEHGRGVEQNIKMATDYYKFASDHGHAEGRLNYGRCLRLLGRWEVPDRSSAVAAHPRETDAFAKRFIAGLDDPQMHDREWAELRHSIARMRDSRFPRPNLKPTAIASNARPILGRGDSAVVRLGTTAGILWAVKTAANSRSAPLLSREAEIHSRLKHPLIVEFRGVVAGTSPPGIKTEVVGNGSFATFLERRKSANANRRDGTRIARIVVGTALAMHFLHSEKVTHGNLTPENILLDWDWKPRVANFARSTRPPLAPLPADGGGLPADSRYLAPECFDNNGCRESDVFAFGLILYEAVVGAPVFPVGRQTLQLMKTVVVDGGRAPIPDFVLPSVRKLIAACWDANPDRRPTFGRIVYRLEKMNFQLTEKVDGRKVELFAKEVEVGNEVSLTDFV